METQKVKFDTSVWQKRMKERDVNLENKRKEVLAYTINFLNLIKKDIPVEEIYLFGSILRENMFGENSDIDIAIKGLNSETRFCSLWSQLDEIPNRNVDLLDFNDCNFVELIIKYGLKIK